MSRFSKRRRHYSTQTWLAWLKYSLLCLGGRKVRPSFKSLFVFRCEPLPQIVSFSNTFIGLNKCLFVLRLRRTNLQPRFCLSTRVSHKQLSIHRHKLWIYFLHSRKVDTVGRVGALVPCVHLSGASTLPVSIHLHEKVTNSALGI